MRQIYTMDELLSIQSNAFRCVRCNKFWLDNQPYGFTPTKDADPNCPHPKLIRTMVVQRREESPQSQYRRKKKRRSRK